MFDLLLEKFNRQEERGPILLELIQSSQFFSEPDFTKVLAFAATSEDPERLIPELLRARIQLPSTDLENT